MMISLKLVIASGLTLLTCHQSTGGEAGSACASPQRQTSDARKTESHASAEPDHPKPKFLIFDATSYFKKPDLAEYGLKPVTVVFWGMIASVGQDMASLPKRHLVHNVAEQARSSTGIGVLDIEHWPLAGDSATVGESIAKYRTLLEWFKNDAPSARFGYYGVAPLRDYWASLQAIDSARYKAWQKQNDSVASIARSADILFPSLYTFYGDRDSWVRYAVAQIREARRYGAGKPVYVFLWPQYHPADKTLAGTYLSPEYWRLELETARKYADGIVIWGGYKETWDETAPWWVATKQFLKTEASSAR